MTFSTRGEMRDEMELLEDEADSFGAEAGERGAAEGRGFGAVDADGAAGGLIETTENVEQRGLAGAGRAHDGDPLAGRRQ